ncbi:Cytosolic Fe-S cluster assembly factor NBP35 [Acorus calamus]|uniref:Cytosolic Fe-S cluster assembly factor NBP35 n=1 Tax=Acorus calamus TaxID=4465 RepID=A0AAV9ETJ6_ACOCL|nr:Cytosolic Fe-S cluster assembly factor NBP35 [Acorus calamus]
MENGHKGEIPDNANEHCPGTESESAGKSDACKGCPNQDACATAPKGPDPESEPPILALWGCLLLFWIRNVELIISAEIAQDRDGGADQFWSPRRETGFWEVRLCPNLNDDEVESYLELLELLQGCSVVPSRRDEIIWRPKPIEGFSVRSGYHWLCREIPITLATARKYNEIWSLVPLAYKNGVSFRGTIRFIRDWGRNCAGVATIVLQGSVLIIQE